MLFSSHYFILFFLPIVVIVYYTLGQRGLKEASLAWLVAASLVYYGWWNPAYIGLIVGSILFNYFAGLILGNKRKKLSAFAHKTTLVLGLTFNLGLLGYYKYSNFFIESINELSGSNFYISKIVLPLAISFFTFQQISYLIDSYQGKTCEYKFLHYCLFVTFFPQLIAGPIVHHKEMIPQFAKGTIFTSRDKYLSIGITVFIIGLFKKVVIADQVALFASPVFQVSNQGFALTFFEAWSGALAYTFQLYFDFSGYSDMAIGLGYMFGIKLPLNFHSPYKAVNIMDFWRRWHITLSRFFLEYLYIPLGGNRKGLVRQFMNLIIVMLLAGLWHGAGWTFVTWGGLHAFYLIVNNAWRILRKMFGYGLKESTLIGRTLSRVLTFLAVVLGWVIFRCTTIKSAINMLKGMLGFNGIMLWDTYLEPLNKFGGLGNKLKSAGFEFGYTDFFNKDAIFMILSLLFIVWFMPNTQQIISKYKPYLNTTNLDLKKGCAGWISWRPTVCHSLLMAITFIVIISCFLSKATEFLYFQF